ncbi:hypothetical protein [Sphingomonas bacterium]|uniref:hypothetical protein n=1 Tax=Sphingomonas bacterium TaxID=1895847 RepID=UPI002629BDCF|nr:hypothetical protein [Sphingomonas bacterium]MDB5679017.1 hypothetical protein [Sphingomonas bacterium]
MILIPLLLAAAPQTTPPPAPPKVDCSDADHRAFDFWIGDWDVSATGSPGVIAHSRIEKIVGCAISETYDQTIGPGGKPTDYHGRSISSYVPADKGWRQFYTDNGGAASTLTGGVAGGAMVLTSRLGPVTNRMTVKPNTDGSVNQRGDFSTDDGKTWKPAYDFTYRKRAAT